MNPTLHIITPVSRPQNVPALAHSIDAALVDEIKVLWWLVFDAASVPEMGASLKFRAEGLAVPSLVNGKRVSVAGNGQRNAVLDQIKDGWTYFLDDDTTLHPRLIKAVAPLLLHIPGCNLVFNQNWPDGSRRCTIGPDRVHQGTVDTGQAVLCRESIGTLRQSPTMYHADGVFMQAVFEAHPESFIFLNEVLSIYNRIH